MRTLALGLVAALLVSGPALAQSPPAKPRYTLETPIHDLMEDARMLAWLDKHFPGLSERMSDPEVGTLFAGSASRACPSTPTTVARSRRR
jgi:hypothetical protein